MRWRRALSAKQSRRFVQHSSYSLDGRIMRPLSGTVILEVWERSVRGGPTEAALELLAFACQESQEQLADMPLPERDRRLLELRHITLGTQLSGCSRCPACEQLVEFDLRTTDLLGGAGKQQSEKEIEVEEGDLYMKFRMPSSRDLLAVEYLEGELARRKLTERCLLEVSRRGRNIAVDSLQQGEIELLGERMREVDPHSEILLNLHCPECGQGWEKLFDIASFFAAEIEIQARRLLSQVHCLARAYGWSEGEILAMSPERRSAYLEMLTA
jgi:hypothetical protein